MSVPNSVVIHPIVENFTQNHKCEPNSGARGKSS